MRRVLRFGMLSMLATAGLLLLVGAVRAEEGKRKLPGIKLPSLGDLTKKDPPITTSIADALLPVPFLDGSIAGTPTPMTELERTPTGGFVLRPGLFVFDAQSYCLKAGTYGPGGGDGYLDAPLKGPQSEAVRAILQNSVRHEDIPQQDIQVLLWAIIARTKVTDMSARMQEVAARLLTPAQILKLNGGALGLIPESAMERLLSNLPAPARRVFEAEARLRSLLAQGTASFEDLERVAILGRDPPDGDEGPKVPEGRWSYDRAGYFVSYQPNGYSHTRISIYAPERFFLERDPLGRLTAVADEQGNRIETSYDDDIAPLTVPRDAGVKGYAFRAIRFIRPRPESGDVEHAEWQNIGWTFAGVPSGTGKAVPMARRAAVPVLGFAPVTWMAAADPFGDVGDRYEKWQERYDRYQEWKDNYDKLKKQRDRQRPPSEQDVQDVTDLGHYNEGLNTALKGDLGEKAGWVDEHLGRVKRAWMYAACRLAGGCEDGGEETKPKKFEPSEHIAVPAQTSRQRLGLAGRARRG